MKVRKIRGWIARHKILTALILLLLLGLGAAGNANTNKYSKRVPNTPTATDSGSQISINNQTSQEETFSKLKNDPKYQNPQPGVAYDELFRNIDKYKGQYFHYKGEVIQVLGDPGNWNLRVNITGKGEAPYTYWEDSVYVFSYSPDRVIEKDIIEFTALVNGTITYKSVLGGDITIPSLSIWEQKVVGRAD